MRECLFVLWANGRHCESRIVADLRERFEVRQVVEITWTPGRVADNFQRFYGDIAVRGVYHTLAKGAGPFLAVTVSDPEPRVEDRMTSRGPRTVNGRFLDAKTAYRQWAGELTIHSTETDQETDRDLLMLFGVSANAHFALEPGAAVESLERDLTGAGGWSSEGELFRVLNSAVGYVVTGAVPASPLLGSGASIELVTDDERTLRTVLGASPRDARPPAGRYRVDVSGRRIEIGIRRPGDGFFPDGWGERFLASRELHADGYYRPPDRDAFDALAYATLLHRKAPTEAERARLVSLASELGLPGWTPEALADARTARELLSTLLRPHGSVCAPPLDRTVFFNHSVAGSGWPTRATAGLTRLAARVGRGISGSLRTAYWQTRDRLLIAFPAVRSFKRWVTG
ncbi:MAG: hypothetical protein ACYTGN_08950 [Planctomycetota bacterium]